MQTQQRIVHVLRQQLASLKLVYLFGSRASGEHAKESDVDIAVLCSTPLDPLQRWEIAEDLARELNQDVDLVDLQQASTVLRLQVVTTGQLLFDADNSAAAFDTTSISMYQKLQEGRREILDDFQAELTKHG